jgi:voltage-gated potassium channel
VTRSEIIQLLDGTHERHGARVAHIIHLLIVASAIAIAVETEPETPRAIRKFFYDFEVVVVGVFTAEYVARLLASRHPLRYAFSAWGIIDLLSILPAIALLQPEWQAVRALRLVRLLKLFRSSRSMHRLMMAFREVRGELAVFGVIAGLLLYVSAVGIYLFEHDAQPQVFSSIITSLWWALASFTTVGYGDMVPITPGGRIFTALVLFIGLGIIAVPAAIVTTALLESETNLRKRRSHGTSKPDDNKTETD